VEKSASSILSKINRHQQKARRGTSISWRRAAAAREGGDNHHLHSTSHQHGYTCNILATKLEKSKKFCGPTIVIEEISPTKKTSRRLKSENISTALTIIENQRHQSRNLRKKNTCLLTTKISEILYENRLWPAIGIIRRRSWKSSENLARHTSHQATHTNRLGYDGKASKSAAVQIEREIDVYIKSKIENQQKSKIDNRKKSAMKKSKHHQATRKWRKSSEENIKWKKWRRNHRKCTSIFSKKIHQ